MEDITPGLIREINTVFNTRMAMNPKMKAINKAIQSGNMTYHQAYQYAKVVGDSRAKAFKSVLRSSVLPDGKMYFNIADSVIRETLPKDFDNITKVSAKAQDSINKKSKIGLKSQTAKLDDDRLVGFIERLTSEENYDDVAWILDNPIREFCSSAVDSTIHTNAEFQTNMGLKVTVERNPMGGCCKWCEELAGVYTYPGVPREIFSRHDNCTCELIYNNERLSAYTSKSGKSNSFRSADY